MCAPAVNVISVPRTLGRVEALGSPGRPPAVYLGRAAPRRPCPRPFLEQTEALLGRTSAVSGTYRGGHPTAERTLNGRSVEPDLAWLPRTPESIVRS